MNNNISKKGRLDVVVKYFYPLTAGIEINIMNVYRNLVDRGWEVYVHTTTDMPDAPDSLQASEEINGLHVKRYKWIWYGFSPEINWKETKAICLHNFNVFPHSWLLIRVWIMRIFGKTNIKVFLTPHGGFTPEWPTFSPVARFFKKIYHQTLGRFLINHVVDGLRSVSEWEQEETIKLGVRKDVVKVIQNGLEKEVLFDVDRLASKKIRELAMTLGKYVVQIGRIHPIKNQKTTIKSLAGLPKDVNFAIIGPTTDFEYEKELKDTVSELGLEERVHFLGVITGIDKYYLLRHSVAGVHMARWESYCNAVHEYMSQGCVCIVSKDTALEELIKNNVNGFCVGVDDDAEVAKKIKYILENRDSQEINNMRKENIDFTKEHSWESIACRVENYYNQFLES